MQCQDHLPVKVNQVVNVHLKYYKHLKYLYCIVFFFLFISTGKRIITDYLMAGSSPDSKNNKVMDDNSK